MWTEYSRLLFIGMQLSALWINHGTFRTLLIIIYSFCNDVLAIISVSVLQLVLLLPDKLLSSVGYLSQLSSDK
jgi:hypothetical protein